LPVVAVITTVRRPDSDDLTLSIKRSHQEGRIMIGVHHNEFYVDGGWRPAEIADAISVVEPATEKVIGRIAAGTFAEVEQAVGAARRAAGSFSQTTVRERVALLRRIYELVLARTEEFAQAIVAEMGAPVTFARSVHVPAAAEHIRVQIDVLKDYAFLSHIGATAIVKEPIGVCALITPWNWPLYQITAKVAPCLAAGCTLILKPSELSPLSALLFAQVVADAGCPPGVFNMINGTGATVGAALAAHPDVDQISITGSTRAGIAVALAAAPTVKRVVQELGGKSPNLLLDDADFPLAVTKGVLAVMRNVGQSCGAPTRMLVPEERLVEVEMLAANAVSSIIVGDPHDENTTMGPLANAAQYNRVQEFIQSGREQNARLICGGLGRPAALDQGFFAKPTIFSSVTSGMRIAQEEIFGPVLSIMTYANENEAIEIANDTPYGLAAYVQSSDRRRARQVAAKMNAGQVHLNYPAWNATAPFGGYKRSGNGREYGSFGLEEFLETKAINGFGDPD
jgi:aldehyde dehydrogenase (NAD+)